MARISELIPLALLFFFVGCFAWIAYQVYLYTNQLAARGQKHMEKKNISVTQGGMRVGVKEMKTEDYSDKTQSVLVKAWNLSTWPEYRSRFWNKDAPPPKGQVAGSGTGAQARPS